MNSTVSSVAVIMGSQSDWPTMRHATEVLQKLDIGFEAKIVSAHRTPERLYAFAKSAKSSGFQVIIAGAGGAAHLPGMVASLTPLPVFGVPVQSQGAVWSGQFAFHRSDAGWHPGWHIGHWQCRCNQCRSVGRRRTGTG